MDEWVQIHGGAGPAEAAAIVSVILRLREEEEVARSAPPAPSRPSAWVRAGLPRPPFGFDPPVVPEPGRHRPPG